MHYEVKRIFFHIISEFISLHCTSYRYSFIFLMCNVGMVLCIQSPKLCIIGVGFILLTRGYGFMGGVYHPPFDTLKISTSTYDMKLKLYR